MLNEKNFNPFARQENELKINSESELNEAKNEAGVVTEEESLKRRILISDDKKIIDNALQRLESIYSNKIKEASHREMVIENKKVVCELIGNNSYRIEIFDISAKLRDPINEGNIEVEDSKLAELVFNNIINDIHKKRAQILLGAQSFVENYKNNF
jgi:hypothetical protein